MYSASPQRASISVNVDRQQTLAPQNQSARNRRIMLAFLCALGTVVTTTFTFATDIKSVLAFGDEGAAAFFRNDRSRSGGASSSGAPRFYAPAPSVPSIFNNRPLRATIPSALDQPSLDRNAKSHKAKKDKRDKLARIKQSGKPEKAGKKDGELG